MTYDNLPEEPALVVPEVKPSGPLDPTTPAFDVLNTIAPVLVAILSPLDRDTEPPE